MQRIYTMVHGTIYRDRTGMRPKGMTARQWKKLRHAGREAWGPRRGAANGN